MNQRNKTMENIKVFTSKFLQRLGQRLQSEEIVIRYINGKSPNFSLTDVKDTILKIETLNVSIFNIVSFTSVSEKFGDFPLIYLITISSLWRRCPRRCRNFDVKTLIFSIVLFLWFIN